MPKIDEASRRLPTFSAGVPIVLGDGQTWVFPKPYMEIRIAFSNGRPAFEDKLSRAAFGPDYWEMHEEFSAADNAVDNMNAAAGLAVHLLRLNYQLSDAELSALLPYRGAISWAGEDHPAIEACAEMWQEIADVATGKGPKVLPAG